MQVRPATTERGTQTRKIIELPSLSTRPDRDILNESLISIQSDDQRDPDWQPEDDDSDMEVEESSSCISHCKEKKYIVYNSCLDELLERCVICGSVCSVDKKTIGTCLVCDIRCLTCGSENSWRSQPMSGNLPVGNLMLCAAIMFSGSSPARFLRALDFVKINNISMSTYNKIQSSYLTPTVISFWNNHKDQMINSFKEEDRVLRLGDDMRCCSPGHTAKYGSYSMIDLAAGKVLDVQLIQVNILNM